MKDILDVFDFKKDDIKEKQLEVLFSMLSKDEKKVFDILKLSKDALTATQIYEHYIDKIISENNYLRKRMGELQILVNNHSKEWDTKAAFARSNNLVVPTNRTITRILENLKNVGFVLKRNAFNKKAKAYYCLMPKLKLILEEKDPDIIKQREIDLVKTRVKQIKEIIKKNE